MKRLSIKLKVPKQLVLLVLANIVALICVSQYYKFNYENAVFTNPRSYQEFYAAADKSTLKQDNYEIILDKLNRDKVAQDDPILIQLIKEHFIELPSTQAYRLCAPDKDDYSDDGQSSFADSQLKQMVYNRLPLSRIPRDSLKHFEISVLRHIRVESEENNKLNNHI